MTRYHDEHHYETAHFEWLFVQSGSDEEDITGFWKERGQFSYLNELAYTFTSFREAESFADNFELDHYPEDDE